MCLQITSLRGWRSQERESSNLSFRTNPRSRLPPRVSFGWQATRRLSTVARSAKVDPKPAFALDPGEGCPAVARRAGGAEAAPSPLKSFGEAGPASVFRTAGSPYPRGMTRGDRRALGDFSLQAGSTFGPSFVRVFQVGLENRQGPVVSGQRRSCDSLLAIYFSTISRMNLVPSTSRYLLRSSYPFI
jgi:hypothetical protein